MTDQLGRHIEGPWPARRIVSLVPSQTELLFDLGLDEEVVGITKFCIHPESWFRSKKRVGGTKQVHRAVIDSLQPDLIIANKEENEKDQIEELARDYRVWISDIANLDQAMDMIQSIGQLCGREEQAGELVRRIGGEQASLAVKQKHRRVLYLIWRSPWMAAGAGTFIDTMIGESGFRQALEKERYPVISDEEIRTLGPDEVWLSSEPYPFKEQHLQEIRAIVPGAKVRLVDGEAFSWYGSRLLHSFAYFRSLHEEHP